MLEAIVVLAVAAAVFCAMAWAGIKLYRAGAPREPRRPVRSDGSFGFITWMLGDSRGPEGVSEEKGSEKPRPPS
jgi:hypothetical protein